MTDDLAELAEILNSSEMFQELARQIIAEEAKKPYRKFFDYYPDEGPLRRALYAKHMEFFRASSDHTEIALIAANRCITLSTPLETDRGGRLASEVLFDSDFGVRSWDGGSRCNRRAFDGTRKSIEPAFRVHLDTGDFFECSRNHRVLTTAGWMRISQLVRLSDGLRCWRTDRDYQANYGADDRPYDGAPPSDLGNGLVLLPLLGGVRTHTPHATRADAWGTTHKYNRAYRADDRLSIQGGDVRLEDRSGQSKDQVAGSAGLWSKSLRRELSRFAREYVPRQATNADGSHRRVSNAPHALGTLARLIHAALHTPEESHNLRLADGLFACLVRRGERLLESLHDDRDTSIFFPSSHPSLVCGQQIECIIPIGSQQIVDFEVAETHAYSTAGVIHHNSGKSLAMGYAITCHLTGNYPKWWPGRKFDEAITCWMAGEDAKTVRDSMQEILFGKPGMLGTGLIPLETIEGKPAPRAGVPDGIDSALIKHRSGGISRIVLKAYDQGRESFQAAKVDVLALDEEPPEDIYAEGLTRTMSTDPAKPNGLVMAAFTPLKGISKVVLMFLPGGKVGPISPSRHVVTIGWNDVPHLSANAKAAILDAYPLHQRDARSRGVPQLGSGAIYPVDETDIVCAPFELPGWYRCVYGLDVGWNRTAALWAALDPETDVLYIYSEHYMGTEVPSVHAAAIQARGKWIPGVIDPAARGRSQHDGQRLFDAYVALGLNNLTLADNAVEAGIHIVYQRMASGKLKVFSNCQNFLAELRVYRRDEKGKVVKENDHLLDSARYVCVSGIQRARSRPPETWDIKKKQGHQVNYDPMQQMWGAA